MICSGALRLGISVFILHHISSLIPPHLRLVSGCGLKVETKESHVKCELPVLLPVLPLLGSCAKRWCVGVGGWRGGAVGDDWTVPGASFPVVFLSLAGQHLSVVMCDHLIPSTVTDRHLQDNKVGVSYYSSLSPSLSLSLSLLG